MTEATGGRRYYNCQWVQEDVKTLFDLLIIIKWDIIKQLACQVQDDEKSPTM
jgi:hypothetical protein